MEPFYFIDYFLIVLVAAASVAFWAVVSVLLETIPAVNRSSFGWFERYFCLFSAV